MSVSVDLWLKEQCTFFVVVFFGVFIGRFLKERFKFPLITGYLLSGVFCGPYVLEIVPKSYLADLQWISDFALSVIAFCAGVELYFKEIRALFRTIVWVSMTIAVFTILLVTPVTLAFTPVMTFLDKYDINCKFGVALVAGAIMIARSPAAALAILKELNADGPITRILLGVTVISDLALLTWYAVSAAIATAQCDSGGHDAGTVLGIALAEVLACVVLGALVGLVVSFILWIPRIKTQMRAVIILPLGWFAFWFCDWFAKETKSAWGHRVSLEALLIVMIAGAVASNTSERRHKFANLLDKSSPYIFLPFFVLTGASLSFEDIGSTMLLAVIMFVMRLLAIFVASTATSKYVLKMEPVHVKHLWMTLTNQAGAALGVASQVSKDFADTFGTPLQSSVVLAVVLNQLTGPFIFKYAIRAVGEAGKRDPNKNTKKAAVELASTPTTNGNPTATSTDANQHANNNNGNAVAVPPTLPTPDASHSTDTKDTNGNSAVAVEMTPQAGEQQEGGSGLSQVDGASGLDTALVISPDASMQRVVRTFDEDDVYHHIGVRLSR